MNNGNPDQTANQNCPPLITYDHATPYPMHSVEQMYCGYVDPRIQYQHFMPPYVPNMLPVMTLSPHSQVLNQKNLSPTTLGSELTPDQAVTSDGSHSGVFGSYSDSYCEPRMHGSPYPNPGYEAYAPQYIQPGHLSNQMLATTSCLSDSEKRRQARLAKNREAAKECRRKKKDYVRSLEDRIQVLEKQNQDLIAELKKYRDILKDSKNES